MKKTQIQMFYEEQRKIANLDHAFMDAVKEGLTRNELQSLIERRPQVYSRFSDWLEKLPEEKK